MADSNNDHEMIGFIASTVETMRDQMATIRDTMATKADTTAIRGDIEQVHIRLDNIERALSTRLY